MSSEMGLSLYFKYNRIRFCNPLIEAIGNPEYIHLFIDSKDKLMYVKSCERDKDAFKVHFRNDDAGQGFYINAKILLQYLSKLVKTDPSISLRYAGVQFDDETVMIALDEYEEIIREQEEE